MKGCFQGNATVLIILTTIITIIITITSLTQSIKDIFTSDSKEKRENAILKSRINDLENENKELKSKLQMIKNIII